MLAVVDFAGTNPRPGALMPSANREDVRFNSGDDLISAWLYRPDGGGKPPLLVMGHGLGAVWAMRLDAYAERFSAAGYACLVFDYRNFGDSEGWPRRSSTSRCSCRTGLPPSPTPGRCRALTPTGLGCGGRLSVADT